MFSEAPGLYVQRSKRDGSPVYYWRAQADLIRAGFLPKNVRLHYASADDPALIARCHFLQAQMMEWAQTRGHGPAIPYDGTFASLWRFFETHPDSPYHDLRPVTQRDYTRTVKSLLAAKGARRVDSVDGPHVRRWYKEIVAAGYSTGWAHHVVTVLKRAVSFGAAKKFADCAALRGALSAERFRQGKPRSEQITYEQVRRFREAAHDMGLDWMALCVTIQFELALRRRDVVGEWELGDQVEGSIRHKPRNKEWIWRDGLTWADIDRQGILRRKVSKTQFTSGEVAVHDIAGYPELARELERVPAERRVGPIIIHHETGVPPTDFQCRRTFRKIARAAGIPDTVWNMDARAGAVSEAGEAGADRNEQMTLATHVTEANSRRYDREKLERSRRVAAKRIANRKGP